MTTWKPDWTTLDKIATAFIASSPLATHIAAPPGGYVATGLQLDLRDILAAAAKVGNPLTDALVIAVDTLTVPAGDTTLAAPGPTIIARSVQVDAGGTANLTVRGDVPGLQLVTAEIVGTVTVAFQDTNGSPVSGGPAALALKSLATPQVLNVSPGEVDVATDAGAVADCMHSAWSVLSLAVAVAIAGVLVDQATSDSLGLAAAMLRWVTGNCYALLQKKASYTNVDYSDVASLLSSAIGLLTFTQGATSGATYVPVLSANVYQPQITGLLGIAEVYDQKITALQQQENIDQTLGSFATTLGNINAQAQGPLLNTLQELGNEVGLIQTRLYNTATQLQLTAKTLSDLQSALQNAIEKEQEREALKAGLDIFFTILNLFLTAGIALADPALTTESVPAEIRAALNVIKDLLDAGKSIDAAIKSGLTAAGGPEISPTETTGAQAQVGSMVSFGVAVSTLWALVAEAVAKAPQQIEYSPDFLSKLLTLPDLSGFSTGGIDPVTYWNTVVLQTQTAVQPYTSNPGTAAAANAYLTAVKLTATYGASVGDLQMKLLDLYNQGISAFMRLQQVYQAQDQWKQLQQKLTQQEQQVKAAIGLLQRGYLDVKRNLVVAVDNYRAAFFYEWLQPSDIEIDPSMDYLTLAQQAQSSITSLQNVLAGAPDGTVKPRQNFKNVVYTVTSTDAPLFSNGQAQWSIAAGDLGLSKWLDGNTAIYLTEATFVLEGGTQTGEVELEIATSAGYQNQFSGKPFRFVSSAISMQNSYTVDPPLTFITTWRFADPKAYMAPSPYTNWTLRVKQGNWQQVTSIKMTLAGFYLQNP